MPSPYFGKLAEEHALRQTLRFIHTVSSYVALSLSMVLATPMPFLIPNVFGEPPTKRSTLQLASEPIGCTAVTERDVKLGVTVVLRTVPPVALSESIFRYLPLARFTPFMSVLPRPTLLRLNLDAIDNDNV